MVNEHTNNLYSTVIYNVSGAHLALAHAWGTSFSKVHSIKCHAVILDIQC